MEATVTLKYYVDFPRGTRCSKVPLGGEMTVPSPVRRQMVAKEGRMEQAGEQCERASDARAWAMEGGERIGNFCENCSPVFCKWLWCVRMLRYGEMTLPHGRGTKVCRKM